MDLVDTYAPASQLPIDPTIAIIERDLNKSTN
jgi:hypothetical protein